MLLSLRPPLAQSAGGRVWSASFTALVFFVIGLYGGAFQAGVGLMLMVALSRSGMDLVVANNVKVVVIMVLTAVTLPVFIIGGMVDWGPAVVLAAGFAVGGALGARLTVTGGAPLIRPVMAAAVLALAGRLLGLF